MLDMFSLFAPTGCEAGHALPVYPDRMCSFYVLGGFF